jgi:hypothetical protein
LAVRGCGAAGCGNTESSEPFAGADCGTGNIKPSMLSLDVFDPARLGASLAAWRNPTSAVSIAFFWPTRRASEFCFA